jgi:predicted hydrocarbon binding protein/KaiC/GvpD/RAD55 family RecA-like ATPase
MERSGVLFARTKDVPRNSLILLAGPPGAGKSTFCHQVVLNGLAMDRPVIFVTTEQGAAEITALLRERGMAQLPPAALSFVDAFTETVGLMCPERPDTVCANCADLNSISIATTRLQERMGQGGILLAFDSLTSPYLFSGAEVIKFMRLFLSRFAAQGNSVVALVDEGCGSEEHVGAMMSVADGILRLEMQDGSRVLNVIKHPRVEPVRIEVPVEPKQAQVRPPMDWDSDVLAKFTQSFFTGRAVLRRELGDFVHLFWPNFTHWSCMLWDPKGFPTMLYEMNKYEGSITDLSRFPWWIRLGFKMLRSLQSLGLVIASNLSQVQDMKRMLGLPPLGGGVPREHSGILEYLDDVSTTDEHHFRVYENSDCTGFEDIGVATASHIPAMLAGSFQGFEKNGRDWNAIETRCLGLGHPYCEFKLVPEEIEDLGPSLEMDSSVVERMHERLMEHLMGFLLHGKPLVNRPRLGTDVHLHVVMHGMGYLNLVGERYRRAQMMGAARSAKIVGQRLMEAGLSENEALKRVLGFLEHCKVGKVTLGETIRVRENCESLRTTIFVHEKQPSCHFTTGFLNGLFSAVKNQHVREIRCIAAGDPFCEWEIV